MYERAPECFFGIACNYFGMHEFDYASESLETYLRLDPDGTYAYDAAGFLCAACKGKSRKQREDKKFFHGLTP